MNKARNTLTSLPAGSPSPTNSVLLLSARPWGYRCEQTADPVSPLRGSCFTAILMEGDNDRRINTQCFEEWDVLRKKKEGKGEERVEGSVRCGDGVSLRYINI